MARVVLFESRKPGNSALVPRRKSRMVQICGMKEGDRLVVSFVVDCASPIETEIVENGSLDVPAEAVYVQARHVTCSSKAAVTVDLLD